MKFFLLAVKTIAFCLLIFSQGLLAEPIQPDRPGFSTGTYTVEPGMTHLEMGLQLSYGANAGDANSLTAPLLNLRIGLTPTLEFNLLMDGVSRETRSGSSDSATSDMLIGGKYRLLSNDQYNLSLLGFVSLATGNGPDSGAQSPFLGLLWDYEVSADVSAFGTLQVVSFVEQGQRSNNFQPAVGLSFSHTETISTYIEYYRDMSLNLNTPSSDVFDAGIAYLLNHDTQLDFNFGISLDRATDDFLGVGYAVRF